MKGLRARDNPFASDRIEALLVFEPEWLNQEWSGLLERLRALDYRAAVVGPHGSGKTTLLSGLKERVEGMGFRIESFFLNDAHRSLCEEEWGRLSDLEACYDSTDETIIFLDGAEQLSWRSWRRFQAVTAHCSGLVISQHRRGKLPLWVKTETNIEMFQEFVRRLAPKVDWRDGELERMFLDSKGNIREALWSCYDRVAENL